MKKWSLYTSKEVKPAGWLKRQLELQAQSLSGNLHKVWPDVRDSKWIGGTAEGWERVPYWLDGFIPMAYLLEDKELISTAKKYMDAIISFQKPDGWMCPCEDDRRPFYDTWAVLLLSKVLTVYYQCSGDEKVVKVLYDMLKNYHDLLKNGTVKLFEWGKYRWYEGFIAIEFLYEKCGEEWLKDLAKILKEQGMDYDTVTDLWVRPLNKWTFDTHIVNLAMMLKSEAVSCDLLGEEYTDKARYFYDILKKYNGMPAGTFTGDECLSGISPIQGAELCSVVELMYTYELLYAYTGDSFWAENLELLAFNALPAAISDDMWAHQYVQMTNQICCARFPGKSVFRTNNSEAHLFGLEPNYGCCTANFSQGWPKLALSAFMYNENEILSAFPVPSVLDTGDVYIKLHTDYPFEERFIYNVEAQKDITLVLRVPSFAKNYTVNGAIYEKEVNIDIKAGEKREISVEFETTPVFEKTHFGLNVLKKGALLYSLPIKYNAVKKEYERDGIKREYPYCDYEYYPVSKWNYGFAEEYAVWEKRETDKIPFSSQNPPAVIKVKLKEINWGYADGYDTVCAKIPESVNGEGDAIEAEMYPYGCAKLRMTELPFVK